jgi:hypothetical protein
VSKYEFIDSQKAEPANRNSVVKMCRRLAVSTSGFYHWASRPRSATSARREATTKQPEPQTPVNYITDSSSRTKDIDRF